MIDPSIEENNPFLSRTLLSKPNVEFCDTCAYLAQNEDLVWNQIQRMLEKNREREIRSEKLNYEKIILFDLDGTLLNEQSQLSQVNSKALEQLKKANYLPVAVSGRAPWEIESLVGSLIDTYVSLNGQVVVADKEVVYEEAIDKDVIENMVKFSTHRGHALAFYGSQEAKLDFVTEAAIKLYQLDNAQLPTIQPDFYKHQNTHMLYLFSEEEKKDIIYQCLFDEYLTMVRDSPYSIAMTANGNSKKTGIQHLLKALNIPNTIPTYAFSDGNDDLSMFELADYTIAMENGSKEIKETANFVTKSNHENGIIHGLKHFGLLS